MRLSLRMLVLFLFAVWLEQSLLPFLLPTHLSLRLVTLLVISLGFQRGPNWAAVVGFLCGIVVSLLTGQPLGVESLSLTCVGWSAGIAAERLHMNIPGVPLAVAVMLLAMEWVLTSSLGWAIFDETYRFSGFDFLCATIISPLVFALSRPFFSRPSRPALYT